MKPKIIITIIIMLFNIAAVKAIAVDAYYAEAAKKNRERYQLITNY